jgi:hypothetical protein
MGAVVLLLEEEAQLSVVDSLAPPTIQGSSIPLMESQSGFESLTSQTLPLFRGIMNTSTVQHSSDYCIWKYLQYPNILSFLSDTDAVGKFNSLSATHRNAFVTNRPQIPFQ